ncbi:MAG TPA: CBS domain-containing protein [Candidatus Dormibacteraeota bacterium]|nr:CBS domain-containing protein [Candidatus Dormibacteraeota bacterium]
MNVSQRQRLVREVMTEDPILASIDLPLGEAARLMDFYRITGLPVVDWTGALVGVISQTDLLHARATQEWWEKWPGLTVRHLMTQPALSVSQDAPLDDAVALLERHGVHRLVVVDADGAPVGVLSTSDLIRNIAEETEDA